MDEEFEERLELFKKQLLEEIKKNTVILTERMDALTNFLNGHKVKEQVNEKMKQAFEKKQIGRPAGSWDDKRKQYLEWINNGKISQPKETTLNYYKIDKDEETGKYLIV